MSLKLYVLIRDDIAEAKQAVQAGHALAQFGLEHPDEFRNWQEDSNILVYLSTTNLRYWQNVLEDGDFIYSMFNEPDYYESWATEPGMYTAIAVAPNWFAQYLLFKDLSLAFQPKPRRPEVSTAVPVVYDPVEPPVRKRWWQ